MNLFNLQQDLFHKIINPTKLTDPITKNSLPVWKVLVYDDFTTNIISNFKIGDLRESNITLHLNVNEKKDPIPGVEAIYLIAPEKVSLDNCLSDIENSIFSNIFINFAGTISKTNLKYFCETIVKLRKTYMIQELKQYAIDFFPITKNSFSLNLQNSYLNQNNDFEDLLAIKLISLFSTLEMLPLIAHDKESDRLKRILQKISQEVENKSSRFYLPNFEKLPKNNKSLLILYESSEDPSSFLYRSFQYLPLLAEAFDLFKNNTIFSTAKFDDSKINIDLKNDKFIQTHKTADYPNIGSLIFQEVEITKQEYDKIVKRPENEFDELAFSENFNEALEYVPIVTEKKKNNENHVKLATFLAKEIEKKHLEKLCVLSFEIFRNKKVSKENISELELVFKAEEIPKYEKFRLFVLLNSNWQMDLKEYEKYEAFFVQNSILSESEKLFLEKIKEQKYSNRPQSSNLFSKFTSAAVRKLKNMSSDKYRCKISHTVNNFFKKREMEDLKIISITKSIEALDPENISQVILFSIDGGNFTEMFEICDLGESLKKDVIYGMTEFLNGNHLMEKIIHL